MHICGISKFIGNCLSHPFSMSQTQHLHVKGNAYGLILGTPYLFWGCPLPKSLVFLPYTIPHWTLQIHKLPMKSPIVLLYTFLTHEVKGRCPKRRWPCLPMFGLIWTMFPWFPSSKKNPKGHFTIVARCPKEGSKSSQSWDFYHSYCSQLKLFKWPTTVPKKINKQL